jgi:predicted DNA repair protein MutK
MAFTGLLALLDDITVLLDDIALMSGMAAKKTAGIVGDDLALNAKQVLGGAAERELPVVWAVAKGSLRNKAILVPAALALSYFAPPVAITAAMAVGGGYLCYEGVEKIAHGLKHRKDKRGGKNRKVEEAVKVLQNPHGAKELEKKKIRGAIQTDFILSAEIIIVALGAIAGAPILEQALVLAGTGVGMTAFVYGLVGGIVRMDDAGFWLQKREGVSLPKKILRGAGTGLIKAAPVLMKILAVAGTLAMFGVGGEMVLHVIPGATAALQGATHFLTSGLHAVPYLGKAAELAVEYGLAGLSGVAAGAALAGISLPVAAVYNRMTLKKKDKTPAIPAETLTPIPGPGPEPALDPNPLKTDSDPKGDLAKAASPEQAERRPTQAAPQPEIKPEIK